MRQLAFLFTLLSFSAMANVECYLNNFDGEHIDFNAKSQTFDSGKPFGVVKLSTVNGTHYLSSIVNGEETIVQFKNKLSLTKQTPKGISVDGDAFLGNIVCR